MSRRALPPSPLRAAQAALRWLLGRLLRLAFRVELRGLEHWAAQEGGKLAVVNHASYLDAPLLASVLPGRPSFAIGAEVAEWWWVRPWLPLARVFRVDPTRPHATRALIGALREGEACVIFPEGRVGCTGGLMKIYDGPGFVADRAGAPVLPIRIDGPERSRFGRMRGVLRLRWLPKVTVTILPPVRLEIAPELRGRARRGAAALAVERLMAEAAFHAAPHRRPILAALLEARRRHGGRRPVLEDADGRRLGLGRLLLGAVVLGRALARLTGPGERVGVLLPNAAPTPVAFLALHAFGRVPALLNFTAGAGGLLAACAAADVRLVVTSRRFVEKARLEAEVAALGRERRVVLLEDLAAGIGRGAKLRGLLERGRVLRRAAAADPDGEAVVLFTSGSEGAPKGVALSHANLLANVAQVLAVIDVTPRDRVLNALPLFHAFGLTGGFLLPLAAGASVVLYPSPLHYRAIPEMAYMANATAIFGTDTFLAGYARKAHPYDFRSLRLVIAGAERVRDDTRRAWADRFGLRILEGYGATEAAPVLAVNTPRNARAGTVGQLLPGVRHRLEPVPGVAGGGRLHVAGPNVMLGYLKADRPGRIQPPLGGWHDTGDVASIDAEGFVRVVGRVKRFAKVAGEMVSLGAVEDLAAGLWPDARHAAVARPDARRGERVVLYTDARGARRDDLAAWAQERGASDLMVPREVVVLDAIPVLGSGKTDHAALAALAAREASPQEAA